MTLDLVDDTEATANYTCIENIDNTIGDTVYYDLDLAVGCGPNPGMCAMPQPESDFNGNEYRPEAQVNAPGLCLNDNGTEEFRINYADAIRNAVDSNTTIDAFWACSELSKSVLWIMSLGCRIRGDDMYERPAPDTHITPFDHKRATTVNPRKVYSLTVSRVEFDLLGIAADFNATCEDDTNGSPGSRYLLDIPADQAFTNESDDFSEYIIVDEDNIQVDRLNSYAYNNTERGNSYSGVD